MSDYYVDVVTKLRDKSQKQIDKLERDYQDTGSASTYRTINKHYDIVKTCDLALEALDGKCHFCERRKRLLDDCIKRYKKLQETGSTIDLEKVIHDLYNIRY
jgi:hypothetical protein